MTLPLIISDTDGRLIYKSRAVATDGFLRAWKKLSVRDYRSGIVFSEKYIFYVKKVRLDGREYLFFMDYYKMGSGPYRIADAEINRLFDFSALVKNRKEISLSVLARLFADTCMPELYNDGIRVVIHEIAINKVVDVPPEAFVLALSIMARLSADDGRVVKFSFVDYRGRITILCDGSGSESVPPASRELLEVMLYEVAAASGFAFEKWVGGSGMRYSLELSPVDIGLLGLKAAPDDRTIRLAMVYAAMFL